MGIYQEYANTQALPDSTTIGASTKFFGPEEDKIKNLERFCKFITDFNVFQNVFLPINSSKTLCKTKNWILEIKIKRAGAKRLPFYYFVPTLNFVFYIEN